jgi:hypothetical protein
MSSWTDNSPVGNPAGRTAVGITTLVMAGSLLVFLHRDIGARLLLRLRILMAAALLIALANIEHPFDWRLAYFAGAFTLLAFFHHWRHMRRIRRGSPEWHSYDTGRSLIFSAAPFLPRSVAQVLLEPVLCGALGLWLAQRSNATFYIGWWIVFASIALFGLENKIRIARREGLLDLGDTVVESVDFARRTENFTKRPQQTAGTRRGHKSWQAWFDGFLLSARAAGDAKRAEREAEERKRRERDEAEARRRQREEDAKYAWSDPTTGRMTPEQALEILELKSGATAADIRAAYNRLMQKVHPDAGGSTFFAKSLNLARDTLLKPQRRAR